MSRRFVIFVALAALAAALVNVAVSGASFSTATSTAVQAASSQLTSDTLQLNLGNSQSAVAGTAVPISPSVFVTDTGGNPVSNAVVTFAVASGGGSVTGGSATSNASGIATVGSWTLGTNAGSNSLTATAAGLSGSPVTFTATGTAGPPSKIALNAGNNQSAPSGSAVAINPSVLVTDANGNPVSGVVVTFAVASGGGSVTGGSATSNGSGIATVTSWTLGKAAGTNTLTATASGLSGSPVTFTATGTASKIAINAGNGQSATVGTAVATKPSVLVSDANNNPVAGVTVTFTIASGGGSVTGASATSNASGIATVGSWTLGTQAGANTLTATATGFGIAPVTFTATGTAGAASEYVVTSSNYSPVAGSSVTISAQLADQYGNPVSTSGIRVNFTASPGGGTLTPNHVNTNASGIATVTFKTGNTVTTYTITASSTAGGTRTGTSPGITSIAGPATKIALSAGNNQSAIAGSAVAVNPSVLVTDANNNPVPGAAVTFAVASGGGSVSGGAATTNASGIAAVTNWTLGTTAGTNTLTAAATGLSGSPVTFTATGTVGPAAKIAVNAGNNQTAISGTKVAVNPSVLVTDVNGNPVGNVTVTFAVASGGGSIGGSPANTNASGIAAVTSWTLGTTVGTNTLTATVAGLSGSPVTFTATGTVGAASKYVVTSSSYTPAAGTAVTITAQLADQYGNPVSTSIAVTFTKTGTGGSLTGTNPTTTNSSGIATISLTTSTTAGTTYTVTATSTGATGTSANIVTH